MLRSRLDSSFSPWTSAGSNVRSIRVVEKAGFRREGRALRYLNIAGRWEDHDIFAMTAEDWRDLQEA